MSVMAGGSLAVREAPVTRSETAPPLVISQAGENGWSVTHGPRSVQLHRTVAGGHDLRAHITTTNHWCCFQVVAPGLTTPDLTTAARQRQALLELHGEFYLARLALDASGHQLLSIDVPIAAATDLLFRRALQALERYGAACLSGWQDMTALRRLPPMAASTGDPLSLATKQAQEQIGRFVRSVEADRWGFQRAPQGRTWRLGYAGRLRRFEADLTVTPGWVCIQAPMLLDVNPVLRNASEQVRFAFHTYLLRLNASLYFARVCLDSEGRPILEAELPTSGITFRLFRFVLRTLAHYLDGCSREVQIMASLDHDPRLAAVVLEAADLASADSSTSRKDTEGGLHGDTGHP